MSSNQGNQGSKQSSKGANEKSPSRSSTTADKGNLRPDRQSQQSQQSGNQGGQQQGGQQRGSQQQGVPGQRQSNDLAGGMPRSPGGSRQAAEQDMDEDTGLSNRANRPSSEIDEGSRQSRQSNVGRRDDGTPD